MKKRNKQIVLLSLLALLLILVFFWMKWTEFLATPINIAKQEVVEFVIEDGDLLNKVLTRMEQQNIIDRILLWKVFLKLHPEYQTILPGVYELKHDLKPEQLLQKFSSGDVKMLSIQFLEGWTVKQVISAVQQAAEIKLSDTALTEANILKNLQEPRESLEGLLFPDTYHYPAGVSAETIIKMAYDKMQKTLEHEWEYRAEDLPYQNAYEALIMASIIEKETGVAFERKKIAGVFVRRLQKNMRLQTDPTVIYGLGDLFNGNLTRKHLKQDTVYNTYTRKGLPPTPIACPGKEAIHAALHPEDGDSLYFVAMGDGTHYFSATLAEHNAAVRKYQLGQHDKSK